MTGYVLPSLPDHFEIRPKVIKVTGFSTDRRHEFQALFDWDVEDKGVMHIILNPNLCNLIVKSEDRIAPIKRNSINI
jgi:hypothetical protein